MVSNSLTQYGGGVEMMFFFAMVVTKTAKTAIMNLYNDLDYVYNYISISCM